MNKVLLSVLILLILNNCSASKKVGIWNKDDKNQQQIENNKTILTKQIRLEEEFNSNLYVKISNGKLNRYRTRGQRQICYRSKADSSGASFLCNLGQAKVENCPFFTSSAATASTATVDHTLPYAEKNSNATLSVRTRETSLYQ